MQLEKLRQTKSAQTRTVEALDGSQDRARSGARPPDLRTPRVQDTPARKHTFLSSIAAARQEAQTLFELSQDLGASLSLGETLSVFSVKLQRLVPYDAIAIYVQRGDELMPEYVSGDNFRLFASLRIPLGQGFRDGWRRTGSRSSTAIRRSSRDI